MLLYHFTSRHDLANILDSGLSRGAVPISAARCANLVWLTADPGPHGHGLEQGGPFMTDAQREQAREWTGILPPPGTRMPKPAEVRIAVELERTDSRLHDWLPWARRNLSPEWLRTLHPPGCPSLRKAKTWRLYDGLIPAERFVAVEAVEAADASSPWFAGRGAVQGISATAAAGHPTASR